MVQASYVTIGPMKELPSHRFEPGTVGLDLLSFQFFSKNQNNLPRLLRKSITKSKKHMSQERRKRSAKQQ